jgi:hypothetical protein
MHAATLTLVLAAACSRRAPVDPAAIAGGGEAEAARLVSEGDAAFANRAEPAQLAAAITAWSAAAALLPQDPEVAGRLAHAGWFAGFEAAGTDAADRWAEAEGWAAPCADNTDEGALACRYWGARAASDRAWARSVSLGLRTGEQVAPIMAAVEQADPGLDGAGATRWRAGWLARIPRFAGGDLDRADAAYRDAVAVAPDQLLNRYERAAFLATTRRDEAQFVEDLQQIGVAPPSGTWEPENAVTRARAAELLGRRAQVFPAAVEPQ